MDAPICEPDQNAVGVRGRHRQGTHGAPELGARLGPVGRSIHGAPDETTSRPQPLGVARIHNEGRDEEAGIADAVGGARKARPAVGGFPNRPALEFRIKDIGVGGVDRHVATVSAHNRLPILRAAGIVAADGAVVLCATEVGLSVRIRGAVVELGDPVVVIQRGPGSHPSWGPSTH